jgi:hypothetical protein
MPIFADDLNDLQDSIVDASHGPQEIPLDLSRRIIVSGTWSIGSGGTLTEGASGSQCRVPLSVPVGCVITRVRLRGQQTGADQFRQDLQGATGVLPGAFPLGNAPSSNTAITGAEQDVIDPLAITTGPNTRYFVSITTQGGGAGNRIITGAFVTTVKA